MKGLIYLMFILALGTIIVGSIMLLKQDTIINTETQSYLEPLGVTSKATTNAFEIKERTEYGLSQNIMYVSIRELIGKNQIINVSHIFSNSALTDKIQYKEILLNQSYEEPVYVYELASIGKYSKSNITNGTEQYFDGSDKRMYCEQVLGDKSCLVKQYVQNGTITKYDYLPIPAQGSKEVINGISLTFKNGGIPLPKNGIIQLKYVYSHPLATEDNKPTTQQNKYDIMVSSQDGQEYDILDPTWWNSSWLNYIPVNFSDSLAAPVNRTEFIKFVVSGLTVTNCTKEIRVVNDSNVEFPSYATHINSSACEVSFVMNKSAYVNQTYYIYFNNPSVDAPTYAGLTANNSNVATLNYSLTLNGAVVSALFPLYTFKSNSGVSLGANTYWRPRGAGTGEVTGSWTPLERNSIYAKYRGQWGNVFFNVTFINGLSYWYYDGLTNWSTATGIGADDPMLGIPATKELAYRNATGQWTVTTADVQGTTAVPTYGMFEFSKSTDNYAIFMIYSNGTADSVPNTLRTYKRATTGADPQFGFPQASGWGTFNGNFQSTTKWVEGFTNKTDNERNTIYRTVMNPVNYTFGAVATTSTTSMTATLNYPIDNYNTTDNTPDLACNFTAIGQNISSVIIRVYDAANNLDYTNTEGSLTIPSYNKTWTTTALTDGDGYKWACYGIGSLGVNASTSNRTISIDTLVPAINVVFPANNTEIQTTFNNVTQVINLTVGDSHLSSCWYHNGTGNTTYTCGTNLSINLVNGRRNLVFYANDTFGNVNQTYLSLLINRYSYSYYFINSSVENTAVNYLFNVSADSITTAYANLSFNGTIYAMTQNSNNGTLATFSRSLTTPIVVNDTLYPIWFNYTLNTIARGSLIYNQTIQNIGDVGTNCTNPSLFFRLLNEETDLPVTATFDYNFQYGVDNSTEKTTYGTTTGTTLSICVNTSISPNYTIGYGEIAYTATGYNTRRYYVYDGTNLNNVTQNITIYSLATASQTTFQLTIKDTTQTPITNKYTSLIRWYPDLNEYRNVDMGKTDEDGNTVIHVDAEDTDYKIGVYETNGSLIKLSDSIRMYCLATPCTYEFIVGEASSKVWNKYDNQTQLVYGMTFNKTTKIVRFVYNDSRSTFNNSRLLVHLQNSSGSPRVVCNVTNTSSFGIINCNLSAYTSGEFIARGYNTRGVVEKMVNLLRFEISQNRDTFGLEGLLLGWFIILTAAMVFLANKIAGVVAITASFLLVRLIGFIEFSALFLFSLIGISIILIIIFRQEGAY